MPLLKLKKLDSSDLGFLILVGYFFFINIFVIKATPEVLFLQFLFLALLTRGMGGQRFFRDWVFYIGFFVLYEFIRGLVDDISPFYSKTLYLVHFFELGIFKTLPTTYLQQHFIHNNLVFNISTLFYSCYFYYSFVAAFLIWIYRRDKFHEYMQRLLLLSYIGLVFFFLFPTAPPWFVSQTHALDITRVLWRETYLKEFVPVSLYRYYVQGNLVAAFPSLHTAWTAYTSIFILNKFGRKFLIFLLIPLFVAFSVVLTGEHYLIDILAGFGFAALAVYIPIYRKTREVET